MALAWEGHLCQRGTTNGATDGLRYICGSHTWSGSTHGKKSTINDLEDTFEATVSGMTDHLKEFNLLLGPSYKHLNWLTIIISA